MSLRIIKTSVLLKNFSLVQQYVTKAYQVGERVTDIIILSQLSSASGLVELDSKRFKLSAKKFIDCNIGIGSTFHDVINPKTIGLLGGVCALATFSRKDLYYRSKTLNPEKPQLQNSSSVINNMSFENFLELVPEVRKMIFTFYESNYISFLDNLNSILPMLFSDIFLRPIALKLYEMLYSRALKQYVSPFISVDLKIMAETFKCTLEQLEKDIAKLIQKDEIKARIDNHNRILYAQKVDQRTATYERIINFADDFVLQTESNLLRMNILKHPNEFIVKNKKEDK